MKVKVTDYDEYEVSGEHIKSRKLKKCEDALFDCAEEEGLVVSLVAAKYGTSADGSASPAYGYLRFEGGDLCIPPPLSRAFSLGLTVGMSGAVRYLVGYVGASELAVGLRDIEDGLDTPFAFSRLEDLIKRWDTYPAEDLPALHLLLNHIYESKPEARSFINVCGGLPCHP